MEDYKSSIYGIILKLIIFLGVIGFIVWLDVRKVGQFEPEVLTTAFMFGILAYLLFTLFSKVGLLPTIVVGVLAGIGLGKLVKLGILTDESSFYVVMFLGALLVFRDIWQVIQYFRYGRYIDEPEEELRR